MEGLLLVMVMAVTVEALVEYIKTALMSDSLHALVMQLAAAVTAVALCLLTGADVFAVCGVTFTWWWVGCVLTGILSSRGANYINDFVSKIRG